MKSHHDAYYRRMLAGRAWYADLDSLMALMTEQNMQFHETWLDEMRRVPVSVEFSVEYPYVNSTPTTTPP